MICTDAGTKRRCRGHAYMAKSVKRKNTESEGGEGITNKRNMKRTKEKKNKPRTDNLISKGGCDWLCFDEVKNLMKGWLREVENWSIIF